VTERHAGWLRRGPRDDDRHYVPQLGVLGTTDSGFGRDLAPLIPWKLEQSYNDCVPNAVCHALGIAQRAQGVANPDIPARMVIYREARAIDGQEADDGGTYIHNAFSAAAKLGLAPDSAFPYARHTPYDPIPIEVFREAADQRWVSGYLRIPTFGESRALYIDAALDEGHAVVVGTMLGHAFKDLQPGVMYTRAPDDLWGGHAFVIVRRVPGGYRCLNSWGDGWCDGGFFLISREQIVSDDTDDATIVKLAPVLEAA